MDNTNPGSRYPKDVFWKLSETFAAGEEQKKSAIQIRELFSSEDFLLSQ